MRSLWGDPVVLSDSGTVILRLDPEGTLVWSHVFDGPQLLNAVAPCGDDIVVAGYSVQDTQHVTRLDPNGNTVWTHQLGPGEIRFEDISCDLSSNLVVGGLSLGSFRLHDTLPEFEAGTFLAKYSPEGDVAFAQSLAPLGSGEYEPLERYIRAVTTQPDGSITLLLEHTSAVALGGDVIAPASEELNMLVARLTATGDLVWTNQLHADFLRADSLHVDDGGRVVVSGRFSGAITLGESTYESSEAQGFLAALNADGDFAWAEALPTEDLARSSFRFDDDGVRTLVIDDDSLTFTNVSASGSQDTMQIDLGGSNWDGRSAVVANDDALVVVGRASPDSDWPPLASEQGHGEQDLVILHFPF